MTITCNFAIKRGQFQLNANFASSQRLLAVFGPSGSGKTTLIDAIAGFIRPDKGIIRIDDDTYVDTDRRIFKPIRNRRTGYVFQDDMLFPHLSVERNLLYGYRRQKLNPDPIQLQDVIAFLGIEHLLDRQPTTLSGGEKKRIAIGRALLAQPDLLLLDEPLASLDYAKKLEILPFLGHLRQRGQFRHAILITHDINEVLRLADDIVILQNGMTLTFGPIVDILNRAALATIFGWRSPGTVLSTRVVRHEPGAGITWLEFQAGILKIPAINSGVSSQVHIRIAGDSIVLATQTPQGVSALNRFTGQIVTIEPMADGLIDVVVDIGVKLHAQITQAAREELKLEPGSRVHALIKASGVHFSS